MPVERPMARKPESAENAVRLPMAQDDFDRLPPDRRAAVQIAAWGAPADPRPKASKITKADVRRAAEAARAIGFDFDELEVGGVVMRRRAASIPAVVRSDDVEAELAAYEASRARR
jgi:hypothetical protein